MMAPPPRWKAETHRVDNRDVDRSVMDCLPLLQKQFPGMFVDATATSLRNALFDSKRLFVRTANQFGLFEIELSSWEPRGVVRERWVVADNNDPTETQMLYRHARDWARQFGATRLVIGPGPTGVQWKRMMLTENGTWLDQGRLCQDLKYEAEAA